MHRHRWHDIDATFCTDDEHPDEAPVSLPEPSLVVNTAVSAIVTQAKATPADRQDETVFAVTFDLETQDLAHGMHMLQCEIYRMLACGIPEFDTRIRLDVMLKVGQTAPVAVMLVAVWRK